VYPSIDAKRRVAASHGAPCSRARLSTSMRPGNAHHVIANPRFLDAAAAPT
jgi:hypothetical protein